MCAGSGTYIMFKERTIQWFCTEEQKAAQEGKPAPWNLERTEEKHWDEWTPTCETDADCPRPDLGQVCTNMLWDADVTGSSFANGNACYNWAVPPCPGDDFASVNFNYENSLWSYYVQYSCTSESSASILRTASAASVLAVFSMF